MENMVNVKINGIAVSVPAGSTVLEAAHAAGVDIPTLCYLKDVNQIGSCRICVVEATGARGLVAACTHPVAEGMEVKTNTPRLQKARKGTLELILSTHNKRCLSCIRSGECELQTLCQQYGVDDNMYEHPPVEGIYDDSAAHMIRDNSKCVLCRRCVAACENVQGIGVIGAIERGINTHIGCAFERDLADVACVSCGQCIVACPTGALHEKDETDKVFAAINDPDLYAVVHTAPSIRATLGECFGMPVGTDVTGKMVAALRRLGFKKVFDTDFAADLTIMEEATEFVNRVKEGGAFPMITSCSPGWIKYCEHFYPEFIPNLSSCKSPQQMMGAVLKTYYAETNGIDAAKMHVTSIMPCTAKKFEIGREGQNAAGVADTDVALTTRELARMIKKAGIDFVNLPDEEFDNPLGESTGASVIFGATGGVMEAALRTAVKMVTGNDDAAAVDFKEVRGTDGIKTATYKVGDLEVKVAVASGTKNASALLERVKAGEQFHFIEIMGCPGGCVNGGGQPQLNATIRSWTDLKAKRAAVLYSADANKPLRKSHLNESIQTLYKEYFGEPGSHKAHHVLHTSYVARKKY